MEKSIDSRKYLCIKTTNADGTVVPALSKCPANPEMVMASLQFLTPGYTIQVSIQDGPIDFFAKEVDE